LYFDLGHGEDYVYHGTTSFTGIHQHDQLDLNEKQKLLYQKEYVHEIYPEYYLIKVNQFNDIAKNTLDEWIYFLKNEEIRDGFHAKGLSEAKEKLDELKLPEQDREEYKSYMENLRYKVSVVDSSYNDGKIDGKIEGKIEGEKKALEVVAKNLLKANESMERIAEITGLSIEEIKKILHH